jgi:hypothetical protein
MPRRFLVVMVAGLALAGVRAEAAPHGVRLTVAHAAGVRFSVDVPQPSLVPLAADAEVTELRIEGFDVRGVPGALALPERVVLVAVPPEGSVRVGGAGAGAESHEGVRLAGVAWFERKDDRTASAAQRSPWVRVDERALAPAPARPAVRLLGVSWLRNQRVAEIAIAPAEYDPLARRLSVARRIDVDVMVEGTAGIGRALEAADPFESIYRDALVNYEQGKAWRRSASAAPDRGGSFTRMDLMGATPVPDTSIYAGRDWVKIAISRTGFYKVTFGQVRNSRLFEGRIDTPLDSVRLYTWPGVPVLPESTYCDSCGYREVAIQFVENGDGNFGGPGAIGNEDAMYFFALGPNDWTDLYDPAQPDTTFLNHPYETRNYYYMAVDNDPAHRLPGAPRRINTETVGTNATGAVTPTSFRARAHFESDVEYWPDATPLHDPDFDLTLTPSGVFWEKWYWNTINRGRSFRVTVNLPGAVSADPVRLRARLWGLSRLFACSGPVAPQCSKSIGVPDHIVDVRFGPPSSQVAFHRKWNDLAPQTIDSTFTGLAETGNEFEVSVENFNDPHPAFVNLRVDRVGLAFFDLFYQRRFEPVDNELTFDSSPSGGSWLYDIGPFTAAPDSQPQVFDVTDPLTPIEIVGFEYAGSAGSYRLRFRRDETGLRRYRIVPATRITRPLSADVFDAPRTSRANLRKLDRTVPGADYVLIYFDGFHAAADSLLTWRRQRLPLPGSAPPYDTISVPISALYDQFSGGRTDPSAIRNFLRAAFFNWSPRPTFVSFLGDASYDFKNYTGQAAPGLPGTLVPSYENGFDRGVSRQFATDDWMLNVDNPTRVLPDFLGGRIPATDAASAMTYVRGRLLHYERSAPLGEWRNRVMLIADDHEQGSSPDGIAWGHLRQTATIDRQGLPPHVDRVYVYLHTYADGPNDTKPGAKSDIIRYLEDGVVMFNYIGHGSPFKISDESVFLDSDASALGNGERPSVFVAASCDVGKFNDASVQSLGERLVLNPAGGCVAVVSATELAFSNENATLNLVLYQELFRRLPITGQYEVTLAEGLLKAKTGGINNQKYQVMGDAAVQLVLPRLHTDVVITSLTGETLTVVPRGQTVRVRGRVLDRPGGSPVPFDGLVSLLIEDSAPIETAPSGDTYPFRASPMFRGDVEVRGGEFDGRWIVPLDSREGPRGRARAYLEGADGGWDSDAVGSGAFEIVPGSAPPGDTEGPGITLSFPGGATSVRRDAVLRIDLFDPSGILITGRTPQNGIIVTIDNNSAQRSEISSSFRYAANSYQSGTAFFQLPNLAPGPHTIRVSAADNLAVGIAAGQHRSSATIDFTVTDNPSLRITRAILFPNPTSSRGAAPGGQFVVDSPGDAVNVLLRIYTVSGRLIRVLKSGGSVGQAQLPWDGLDAEGFPLANGVYLFRVHVNPRDADGTSSARQEASAEGRFVIVNH